MLHITKCNSDFSIYNLAFSKSLRSVDIIGSSDALNRNTNAYSMHTNFNCIQLPNFALQQQHNLSK